MGNTGITNIGAEYTPSKLTRMYQATIPERVQKLLHLNAGDEIAFDIEDKLVNFRKPRPVDLVFAQSLEDTLNERASEAGDKAYSVL